MVGSRDFGVYRVEDEFYEYMHFSEARNRFRINILKLHGCIDLKESIRTTIRSINENELWTTRRSVLDQLFRKNDQFGSVLILGYSLSDTFDVNKIINSFDLNETKYIYLIQHHDEINEVENFKIEPLQTLSLFRSFEGIRITGNTNILIEYLWQYFGRKDKLNFKVHQQSWKGKLAKYYGNLSLDIRHMQVTKVYDQLANHQSAVYHVDMLIDEAKMRKDKELLVEGMLYKAILFHKNQKGRRGNIEKSLTLTKKANALSRKHLYQKGIADSEHMLGLIHAHSMGKYEMAEENYNNAIKAYRHEFDMRSKQHFQNLSKEYLSLASLYRRKKEFKKAFKFYRKARILKKKIGNVAGVALCDQGLGNLYLLINKYGLAKKRYENLLKLAQELKDRELMGTANFLLAELCFKQDKLIDIMEYLEKAIDYRKEDKSHKGLNVQFLKLQIDFKQAKNNSERRDILKKQQVLIREFRNVGKDPESLAQKKISVLINQIQVFPDKTEKKYNELLSFIKKYKNYLISVDKSSIQIIKKLKSNRIDDILLLIAELSEHK